MARPDCPVCLRALPVCLCHLVKPFAARAEILILRHPREKRSRLGVNTAQLVALAVRNCRLLDGLDFERDNELRGWLEGASLVYPGRQAVDLTTLSQPPRKLVFLDGSWRGAAHLLRRNDFLAALPRLTFRAPASRYGFRRQPRPECASTAEAVYWCLEQLPGRSGEEHANLLELLDFLVSCQARS